MTQPPVHTDHLIIGQGLAGTLLAFALLQQGQQVFVIDEAKAITSSRIAAGMFTPISGKRMTKSKTADALLELALQTYRALEKWTGTTLLYEQDIYQVFGSVKEQNDFSLKVTDDTAFSQHIILDPPVEPHLKQAFGAFGITGSGWVNTPLLLQKAKEQLQSTGAFLEETFDHAQLQHVNGQWQYKHINAAHVIFCEGALATHNPFFANLPFDLCKGDVLLIRCPGISKKKIIKKGVYLVHLHDDVYKAGSTYNWRDLSEAPSEAGKQTLTQKLDELLDVPYTILTHQAAIRPTTRNREPFIAQQPEYANMYMLNGLGTKGVMKGPWWIQQLLALMTSTARA